MLTGATMTKTIVNENQTTSERTFDLSGNFKVEQTIRTHLVLPCERIYWLANQGISFRLGKIAEKRGNGPVSECKIKDVYLTKQSDQDIYSDVTIIRTKTLATDGALSVKERQLNCIAMQPASNHQSVLQAPISQILYVQ